MILRTHSNGSLAYFNDSLAYDLFVIDPKNKDTTPEQLRDCIYDALKRLDMRTRELK